MWIVPMTFVASIPMVVSRSLEQDAILAVYRKLQTVPVWIVVGGDNQQMRTKDKKLWWFFDQNDAQADAMRHGGKVQRTNLGEFWLLTQKRFNPDIRFQPGAEQVQQAKRHNLNTGEQNLPGWVITHQGSVVPVFDPDRKRQLVFLDLRDAEAALKRYQPLTKQPLRITATTALLWADLQKLAFQKADRETFNLEFILPTKR